MHRAKRVAGTGQTAAGTVGEEALLTVLTLEAGVASQAGALTSGLVTFLRVQDALSTAAAVAADVWGRQITHAGSTVRTVALLTRMLRNT